MSGKNSRPRSEKLVDPLFVSVTKRLRQISHEIDKHSKYLQERHNITVPQTITLREIYEHGPLSFTELTEIVSLNNSTVTGIVDRLERQGFVQRVRGESDRRRIDLTITDAGIERLEHTPPPIQDSFIAGLARMDDIEVQTVNWAIDTILALLREEAPPEIPDTQLERTSRGL